MKFVKYAFLLVVGFGLIYGAARLDQALSPEAMFQLKEDQRQERLQVERRLLARSAPIPTAPTLAETEEEDPYYAHESGETKWESPQPPVSVDIIGCWCEGDTAVCNEGQDRPLFRKHCAEGCSSGECD